MILFEKDAQMLVTNALLSDNLGGLDITKKLEGSPTENNPEEKKISGFWFAYITPMKSNGRSMKAPIYWEMKRRHLQKV